MRVVVRVRPANEREIEQRSVVKILDELTLMFDPKEEVDDFYFHGTKQIGRDLLRKSNKELRFNFDTVFSDAATNEQVHCATTMPILEGLLNGYNCSVFAYGATGAGKTFTMLGNTLLPGITFLAVMELFHRLEALRSEMIIDLGISYLEVYNENVKDLLTPGKILAVREDQHRGVIVPGLSLHKPKGAEELLEMLRVGNHRRTQHPTDANAESSRSHAVFTIYIRQQDRSMHGTTRVSKMALIDLAGSERACMVSRGNGSRLREGANINKSLLSLGNCINALADKKGHVPFRDSKLTRLLKDSLDGNCRTVMIAAISPAVANYEDTYNTLKYASRARNIKTTSKQNIVDLIVPNGQHMKVIQDLQNEVASLKLQLQQKPLVDVVPQAAPINQSQPISNGSEEVESIRGVIRELFTKRETLTRQFLEVSCQVREMELRVQRRQKCMERLALISVNTNRMDHSASKMDIAVARMAERRERQWTQRDGLALSLAENSAALFKAEEKAAGTNSEILSEWLKTQHSNLDIKIAKFREQHACRAALIQEQETKRCDRLVSEMSRVVQRQYLILIANGLATSDIVEDFNGLLKQVEGIKEVAWADQLGDENADPTQLNIGSILNLSISPLDMQEANSEESTSAPSTATSGCPTSSTQFNPSRRLYSPTCGKLLSKISSGTCQENQLAITSVLNSTFSKEQPQDAEGLTPRSSRRLTFDAIEPLVLVAGSSLVSELEKENAGPIARDQHLVVPGTSKRQWVDSQRSDVAKKLKSSASLSNLSTAKSLRKFGIPSMFDKPKRCAEVSTKIKLSTFSKFTKLTPSKRNVLEPINTNGLGIPAMNPPQSLSAMNRQIKPGLKPTVQHKTNAPLRRRSKSVTCL